MAARVVMPSLGMYTAEGRLTAWLAEPGSEVAEGQPIVELETEKSSFEVVAPAAGRFRPVAALGTTVRVEELIGWVLAPGEPEPRAVDAPPPLPATGAGTAPLASARHADVAGRRPASPAARRLAGELGVDLAGLAGSGPGGRIVEADVRRAAEGAGRPEAVADGPAGVPWRVRERIPLAGLRGRIADRLRRGQSTAVALTLTREVDARALVAARRALAGRLDAPLPWDALFVRLFAEALRERGELNAVVLDGEILRLDEVHVAFAVPVEGGLVAPVVREPDRRPLAEVAREVRELAARARARRLAPDELAGATATVSNLGAHGVDAFTPALDPPQSVILGVGRIAERAVVDRGEIAIAATCVLSLTFDHRVADGAPAAELLAALARRLTDAAALDALG